MKRNDDESGERYKEPKHKTEVEIRTLVPELHRDNCNEEERWMTRVEIKVMSYRCPRCKKKSSYILCNGFIVKGCGGVYSADGYTCDRCTAE